MKHSLVKKRFYPLPRNDLSVPLHLSQIEPDYFDFIGIALPAVVGLIFVSMSAQHCGGNGKLQSRTDVNVHFHRVKVLFS